MNCDEIIKQFNLSATCCSSCHWEAEEGYSSLLDIDLPDGSIQQTCCVIARAYDKILEEKK